MEPGPPPDPPAPVIPEASVAPSEPVPAPAPPPVAPAPIPVVAPRPPSYWQKLEPDDRSAWKITVYGLIARLIFVQSMHPPLQFDYSDMHGYIERALHFANPDAPNNPFDWYYPSGTSVALALFLKLFSSRWGFDVAGLFQAVASGLEIYLVYAVTKRWFSSKVGLLAATLLATHYLAFSYAGFFLSESYLEIGLVGACALLIPEKAGRCLLAGAMLGFGAWAKSQAVLLAPGWALVLIGQRRYRSAAALLLGTALVVIPVSIFASNRSERRAFISNNGGQTFALAHCPIQNITYKDTETNSGATFTVPVLNQRTPRGEVEASWGDAHYTVPFMNSGFYFQEGLACIKRYPGHALRMVFLHLFDTFSGPPWSNEIPWPDSHTEWWLPSMLSNLFVSYLVAPLAFWGMWRNRRRPEMWLFGILPLGSVLASAVLFHGDPRFRAPYDLFLFIAAALAWEQRRAAQVAPAIVS